MMKDIRKYDVVVLNHRPDAAIYRVTGISGLTVSIELIHQEALHRTGPQTVDRSLLLRPNRQQLKMLDRSPC